MKPAQSRGSGKRRVKVKEVIQSLPNTTKTDAPANHIHPVRIGGLFAVPVPPLPVLRKTADSQSIH